MITCAHSCVLHSSGVSTASPCVWNPSGRWRGTIMSERFYMLRESIISAYFLCWTAFLSFTVSNKRHIFLSFVINVTFSLFRRICVPGGFMLATVLGCVCLGIASLIYLAVSWQFFTTWISSYSRLNIDKVDRWGRKWPVEGNKEIATRKRLFRYWYLLLRHGSAVMKSDQSGVCLNSSTVLDVSTTVVKVSRLHSLSNYNYAYNYECTG